jgi:heptosyltransferase-2
MRKILIVAPAWVGDAVLSQPLFKRLHQRHRELTLDVFAPAWTLPVFARMPEINATIATPFQHGELALSKRRALGRQLAAEHYEQAIVLPNSFKSALVPWFADIPLRTGFVGEMRQLLLNDARRLDKTALPQMAERFAFLAATRGEPLQRPLAPPHLDVNEAQRAATLAKCGVDTTRPVVVLCPGAEYGPAKRWPPKYFAQLGKKFAAQGYAVWLVGSLKDAALGAEIAQLADSTCRNLCGDTSLDEAIDLLSCAALVISNDSGLMHVAAALGKPLIALYGSSSPTFTPPLSDAARIVRLDLPCSPCFQRVCPLRHFNCMMQLTPEHVWQQIDFAKMPPP